VRHTQYWSRSSLRRSELQLNQSIDALSTFAANIAHPLLVEHCILVCYMTLAPILGVCVYV